LDGLSREEKEGLLKKGCDQMGISLSPLQADRFMDFLEVLKKWNRRLNLTGLRDDRDIILKHFLDSLTPLTFIPEGASLMDIGSGAGFPGLPIQIVRPDQAVTLVEASAKKTTFLKEVCRRLGLRQTVVLCWSIGQTSPPRPLPLCEVAITRAVGRPLKLLTAVYPHLKRGGKMIFLKGSKGFKEAETAKARMEKIGFSPPQSVKITLPVLEQERMLYILTKD
jgi:16S rRNA (guanine527-N7)-methyltransferase